MALSITGNIDRNTMLSGLVVSTTNLTERIAPQLVAGDKISIDVFLTSSDGIVDIQQYAVQRLGLGVLNSKPTGGTYKIDYGSGSDATLAFDASAQSFADAINANAPTVPSPVTGTEIAPFTYIIQFGSNGTCPLPTIDSSSLSPSSTVSVQRLITGDSSTKERWIVRLYENPLALIDGSWTNIEPVTGRKGIRGALNLGTQGIFDLLDGNPSASVTMELELTDSAGNLQTIFQSPCIVFSQVIGESISGVIPAPSGIPASATDFLNSFPNPSIAGDLDINGGLQVFGDTTFEESADFEKGAEFKDGVTLTTATASGNVSALRLITNEIQSVGTTSGTAQPITYDSKEHRFRDYDETPNNLMVIKKADGVPVGKVGINHNNPVSALHVVGGHTTGGGIPNEALRVVGSGLFTSTDQTALVVAGDTDDDSAFQGTLLKLKRDAGAGETVDEINTGYIGSTGGAIYSNSSADAAFIQVINGRKLEIATGATSARRLQVSDSGIGVDGGVELNDFTATSRSTDLSALSPTQNNQPATDDTVTELCVDPSGNVVRGSQEATWTFTRAQLNGLTEGTRYDLLSAPGTDKCLCVEESNWLIESDSTQSGTYGTDITCEIEGASVFSVATRVTAARLTTLSGSVFNGQAIYTRDVPETDKQLAFNKGMTIRIPNHSEVDNFPAKLVSVRLKIKYRVFDKATF